MPVVEENYDVVVVGAGHAGCEAALASARLGLETILFTVSMDSVAMMPCNPNVGGSSKGHLVREMDALGGEMGKNIDKTYIQSKMLNASKGPAVHSLRAQADKSNYSRTMKHTLENTDHLVLRQAEVSELMVTDGVVKGVKTFSGATYYAKAVVLCTGTYLKARCIYGDVVNHTGPNGLMAANHLSDSMKEAGIDMDIVEDGSTFEENAIIKAKAVMERTGQLALADDSGLEIDALNKEPGIYSARYMGEDTPYEIKNRNLIERMKGVKGKDRSARFVCVIAAAFPDGEIITTRGTIEGVIAEEPAGENGFGYDPIVYVPEYGMTTGQMDPDAKNAISHRGKALTAMKKILEERKIIK